MSISGLHGSPEGAAEVARARIRELRERVGSQALAAEPGVAALLAELESAVLEAQAEGRLRESEERFRQLAENIREVFYIAATGPRGIIYVSPIYDEVWGRPHERLYEDPWDMLQAVHPDDRERVVAGIRSRISGEHEMEYRIVRPDGEVRWIRDRSFPVRDRDGEVYRYAGLAEDVTQQRRIEERHRFLAEAGSVLMASSLDSDTRLGLLARLSVPVLADLCVVDVVEDGSIRRVAAAHADPEKAALAERLLHHPPRPDAPVGVAEAIRTGEAVVANELPPDFAARIARDAEHRRILAELALRAVLIVPLRARGRTLGAITFASSGMGRRYGDFERGVAEEFARQAGLALDNARLYEEARRAVRAREDVVGVVSHELRAPLHAVRLITELLAASELGEGRVGERLGTIGRLTEQMARLVDDLLDLAHVESGQLRVRPTRSDAAAILEGAGRVLAPIAERSGIQLVVEADERLPAIAADRQRVLQILTNLVTNALRSAPRGSTVTVRAAAGEGAVRFSVADRGRGIAPADLPHLFDRYWRASRDPAAGTGLGLAIAKGLVEAHGGEVWVDSREARGTTIGFTIPLASPGTPAGASDEELRPPPPDAARPRPVAPAPEPTREERTRARERRAGFLAGLRRSAALADADGEALVEPLREQLASAMLTGRLRTGDRLPSIRALARALRVEKYAVTQAYHVLEQRGWVEKRERSGVYVASLDRRPGGALGETAQWLTSVITDACHHRIRVPYLPELLRRWTCAVPLRCACIESDEDSSAALCAELVQQFGLEAVPLAPEDLPGGSVDPARAPAELAGADLLVTTALHAGAARRWAEALDRPLLVATLSRDYVAAIEERLRGGTLAVVCVDPEFGERVRRLHAPDAPERVRVVLAEDQSALQALDPDEPVLLTRAARRKLGAVNLRLLVPYSSVFSPEFAQRLAQAVVRLNVALGTV